MPLAMLMYKIVQGMLTGCSNGSQRDVDRLFKWFRIIEQDIRHDHIW